jgi:DNA polymerase III delta prime subunit
MELIHHGTAYLKKILNDKSSSVIHIKGDKENFFNNLDIGQYNLIADIDAKDIKLSDFKLLIPKTYISSSKKKIFIISNADLMSSEIYNSILKVLEEPIDTFFILISKNILPSTISSRAIEIAFSFKKSDFSFLFDYSLEEKIFFLEDTKNLEDFLDFLIDQNIKKPLLIKSLLNIKKLKREGSNVTSIILLFLKNIKKI